MEFDPNNSDIEISSNEYHDDGNTKVKKVKAVNNGDVLLENVLPEQDFCFPANESLPKNLTATNGQKRICFIHLSIHPSTMKHLLEKI